MFGKNIWSLEVQRRTKSNRNPGKKHLCKKQNKIERKQICFRNVSSILGKLGKKYKIIVGYFPAPPGPSAVPLWKQLLVKIDHEDKICCAALLLLGQPN